MAIGTDSTEGECFRGDFPQRIFLGAHTHHVGTVPRGFNEIILLVGAYDMVL